MAEASVVFLNIFFFFQSSERPSEPSSARTVATKVLISFLCAGVYTVIYPYFPITKLKGEGLKFKKVNNNCARNFTLT